MIQWLLLMVVAQVRIFTAVSFFNPVFFNKLKFYAPSFNLALVLRVLVKAVG